MCIILVSFYIFYSYDIKNVAKRIRIFSILGGIETGPLNWGGVVPRTQKWGGDPLAAEGRAILGTPPQCVFGTFPKIRNP